MKKILTPASLAFILLSLLFFFILGMYIANWTDVGKNQGLAGGAIVLGYGVLFALIGFVASFFIVYFLSPKLIKTFNWILLILIIISFSYKYIEFRERDKLQKEKNKQFEPTPSDPTAKLERNAA